MHQVRTPAGLHPRALGDDRPRALACNWAVPEKDEHRFCRACRLNDIIPNLSDPKAKQAWIRLEQNKRRLVYTLLELGLPVEARADSADASQGLGFAFKQDLPGEEKVYIAHDHGLITINIAEADSPFREKTRIELGESYRTAGRELAVPRALSPALRR